MIVRPNIKNFISLLLILVLLASCKSTKTIAAGELNNSLSAKKIIQNHYENELDFETISGKVKIDYSDGENSQGVSVSLRMKKNEVIWISAPLGMVKAHITPDKVSFYNRLENEYFHGDYSYLSNILGTEVDFQMVQNLLVGNAILDLRKEKYATSIMDGTYNLKPKKQLELYKILFFLEPTNFKIAQQQISQPSENRFLKMDYSYQEISNKVLPNKVDIEAISDDKTNTIELEYRGIEFNRKLNFPYKIPKGFNEIVL